MKKLVLLFASTLVLFACSSSGPSTEPSAEKVQTPPAKEGIKNPESTLPDDRMTTPHDPSKALQKFSRVIYIVFENEDQRQVISNAYFKALAARGVNFTNLKAETHPSQGNYIAMMAGDTYGVDHDRNVDLNVPHLGDLLDSKNKTWKLYAEGFPGECYIGSRSGKYARKHAPFMSFLNVSKNKMRCGNIISEKTFFTDWKAGALPNFSMYIPDLNNDGHDTSIDYSATWLKKNFEAMFNNADLMKDTLIILTYDESSFFGGNTIYNVFLGPMIKSGSVVTAAHSHYSLLKMIEDEWELGSLNRGDAKAPVITGIWK